MQFNENERQIFSYHNGIQDVFCDPQEIYRRLMIATRARPNDLHDAACKEVPDPPDPSTKDANPDLFNQFELQWCKDVTEQYEAQQQFEALVRDLFKMVPFEPSTGEGATWDNCLDAWERFADFLNQKNAVRDIADVFHAYGWPYWFRPDYGQWVGLQLNIPRVHLRTTRNIIDGMNWAKGGQVPFEVFDSAAFSAEEAEAVMVDENVQRAVAESIREARR